MWAAQLAGEFHHRLDQALGAAGDAQIVDPLRAGIEPGLLAAGHGFVRTPNSDSDDVRSHGHNGI